MSNKQKGWRVNWYNYYWEIETHIVTDEEYQDCIANDPGYYRSAPEVEVPRSL